VKKISPKKILAWTVIAGSIILLLLLVLRPEWFPGILYPAKDFDLELLNPVSEPDLRDRDPGESYPEGFFVIFRHDVSSQFTHASSEFFFVNRPRKELYIKEAAWEWAGGSGIFAQDVLEDLTEVDWLRSENGWKALYFYFIPDNIPFIRMFRKKKIGEVFPFRLTIRYRLDDEPEIVQALEYQVTARKGRYERTYTFLF
jgi:hypothetical protein